MDNQDSAGRTEENRGITADKITLKVLVLSNGRCPFADWYYGIKDTTTRQRMVNRLARVRAGNLGDVKPVGSDVYELRLDFGPGYRIYFARIDEAVVVLLAGGDKSSQQKDIDRTIEMWKGNKNNVERYQRDF